jgi:hypothetical protein
MKEPQGFPTFWEIWRPHARKTDGRKLARETFAKHVRSGADAEDIIHGAAWFLRTMKERDREFIPLSSTWMNRGTYEDDCILERQRIAAILERERNAAMEQVKRLDNVVQMNPPRPSEAERAAHVERMRAKLRGNA